MSGDYCRSLMFEGARPRLQRRSFCTSSNQDSWSLTELRAAPAASVALQSGPLGPGKHLSAGVPQALCGPVLPVLGICLA